MITRTITDCTFDTIWVETAATGIASFEADPDQTYSIDPRSLSNWAKMSDLSIEKHHNGMLKSISASAEDRTGPIATSILTGVARIASSVTAGAAFRAPERQKAPICLPEIETILRDGLPPAKAKARAAMQAVADATARLRVLTNVAGSMGGRLDSETQSALIGAARELGEAQLALEAATATLNVLVGKLTDVQSFRWPKNGRLRRLDNNRLSAAAWRRWTGASGGTERFQVALQIIPTTAAADLGAPGATEAGGIRYRIPAKGRLIFCPSSSCPEGPETFRAETLWEGLIPQLGRIHVLPYSNGMFQKNLMKATFQEDGDLLTGSYTEHVATGEVASGTFAALAQTAAEMSATLATSQTTKLNTQKDRIAAEVGLLKAEAERRQVLMTLRAPAAAEARSDLIQADTDLLSAQRAALEARLLLEGASTTRGMGQ